MKKVKFIGGHDVNAKLGVRKNNAQGSDWDLWDLKTQQEGAGYSRIIRCKLYKSVMEVSG